MTVNTNNHDKPYPPALPGTKWAVVGCRVEGPGWLTNFYVNGRLVVARIEWKHSCVIERGVGLMCDGVVIANVPLKTNWCVERMNVEGSLENQWAVVFDRFIIF